MTDLSVQFTIDARQTAAMRGALPDAPLAMPAQRLEVAPRGIVALLTLPLRLLRLPLSRGI